MFLMLLFLSQICLVALKLNVLEAPPQGARFVDRIFP
jgi:hypothetical protein